MSAPYHFGYHDTDEPCPVCAEQGSLESAPAARFWCLNCGLGCRPDFTGRRCLICGAPCEIVVRLS